jgi:uncharacterized protein
MFKKKSSIVRIIYGLIVSGLLIVMALSAITWYMVYRYMSRPQYEQNHLEKIHVNKERLLREFGAQPVLFTTQDNIELSGLLIERPNAKRVIMCCHGYSMAKERMLPYVQHFSQDTVLLFDFRAHGESKGDRTTIGNAERADVHAAINFLKHNPCTKDLLIIGIGISMGAVSLLGATAEKPMVDILILDSSFAQLVRQAKTALKAYTYILGYPLEMVAIALYTYFMGSALCDVDAVAWASQVAVPTLMLHSDADRLVPIGEAQEVYTRLASEKKDFISFAGSAHARIFEDIQEYYHHLDTFIALNSPI